MEESICYTLLLGSNLGDKALYLKRARDLLDRQGVRILGASSIHETEPWGNHDQPTFLNQVICVLSKQEPEEMLALCQLIEQLCDRKRTEHWGARTLDIDILAAEQLVVNTEALLIPHPLLHQRAFALMPMAELQPDWVHPILQKTTTQMLSELMGSKETLPHS